MNEDDKRKRDPDAWKRVPKASNCVTIFGAGIAGLSAAHELVERGYRVQVWEPVDDPRHPHRGCDVGGLARTQWSRVPWPDNRELDCFHPEDVEAGRTGATRRAAAGPGRAYGPAATFPIVHLPQRFAVFRPPVDADLQLTKGGQAPPNRRDANSNGPDPVETLPAAVKGYEVNMRGYEGWSEQERFSRANRFWAIVCRAVTPECVEGPPLCFDRSARVFRGQIETTEGTLEVVLLGGLRDQPDPDVLAVVRPWTDDSCKLDDVSYDIRLRPVAAEDIEALGQDGPADAPAEVLLEIVETLVDNPQIGTVYVEVSDPEAVRDKALAQQKSIAVLDVFKAILNEQLEGMQEPRIGGRKVKAVDLGEVAMEYLPDQQGPVRWQSESKITVTFEQGSPGKDQHVVELRVMVLDQFPPDLPDEVPEDLRAYISLRVRERWLPGEHGYRFFPAFYHHLFDTMKRTPILETQPKSDLALAQERSLGLTYPEPVRYVETGRTAFDNLRSTRAHVLAFGDGRRPSELSRLRVRSFEELRRIVQVVLNDQAGGFGVPPRELYRLSLKVVEFLTSCNERRKRLETISWWDFVEGDTYSPGTQKLLQRWPEALVAMDARVADARTHGVAMVQLIIDNANPDGYRDGTLVAPTSEAWLNPWRRYLEAQGVEFVHGEITDFEVVADSDVVWPIVECYEPRFPRSQDTGEPLLMQGYFVLAVAADQASPLAHKYLAALKGAGLPGAPPGQSDFHKLAKLGRHNGTVPETVDEDLPVDTEQAFEQATGTRDFRHYGGIQFYFAEDVYWVDGHVYHVDSRWSLTSISQARFWQDRTDWEHGYRGVLSVVIGSWQIPGLCGKTAWECEPQRLAEEVWAQIKQGLRTSQQQVVGPRRAPQDTLGGDDVPEPLYWHLDDRLQWDEKAGHYRNQTPFFISTPHGRFDRPGDPETGYMVEHGYVWAGMHCRTFSRIPSMEAANESARHAVNAILRRQSDDERRFRRTLCDIWNPEDREVEDLRFAQDLDQKLVKRGLPHAMELFDLDRLAATTLRGGPHDPLDPLQLGATAKRWLQRLSGHGRG